MTWTKINTFGLQDRFQVRTRQEIYKFNQINSDFNDYGESIWIQSERDELNIQLNKMFYQMQEWLGFYPRPIWKQIKIPLDYYYFYTDLCLKVPESAYLQALGVRGKSLILANATYVKSGTPTNIATFTITTTQITDGEIALFHTATDAFNNVADDRFRVYPTNIYYNGTAYVIEIPYARLLKPVLQNTEFVNSDPRNRNAYNVTTDANFVSSLDVYRIYNDTTVKSKIIGSPYNFQGSQILEQEVDVIILDEYDSEFKIIENSTYPTFNPTHIILNAYIGYPLNIDNNINGEIEEMIIRKTKVEMGTNARLSAAKISTQWDFDELPAYTKANPNDGRGGVGFMPNPIGSLNVDIEMFKRFLPIANWRGKITDERFWIR